MMEAPMNTLYLRVGGSMTRILIDVVEDPFATFYWNL